MKINENAVSGGWTTYVLKISGNAQEGEEEAGEGGGDIYRAAARTTTRA